MKKIIWRENFLLVYKSAKNSEFLKWCWFYKLRLLIELIYSIKNATIGIGLSRFKFLNDYIMNIKIYSQRVAIKLKPKNIDNNIYFARLILVNKIYLALLFIIINCERSPNCFFICIKFQKPKNVFLIYLVRLIW